MAHDDLVPAHRASNRAEAEIVRMILEDAGIFVLIPDKNTAFPVDLNPLDDAYVDAGCEVQVPARDVDRAREVIAEAREAGRLAGEDIESAPDGLSAEP